MENLLTKKAFKCNRYCGECCKKMLVFLGSKDIKNIKGLGYNEEEFLEKDPFNKKRVILRKDGQGCVFLKKDKNDKYSCRIYENRPDTCRKYPFFTGKEKLKSCLPNELYPNVFFSFGRKNNQ